jgi:hypothetical protein
MPVAVLAAVSQHRADPALMHAAVWTVLGVTLGVAVFSLVQFKRGRWAHPDASNPDERRQLTAWLTAALAVVALLVWRTGGAWPVVAALSASALLAGLAHLSRRRLKLSLHVGYAVLAASFLWPLWIAIGPLLAAAALAWSRLRLARHTVAEVWVGAAAGAFSAVLYQVMLR